MVPNPINPQGSDGRLFRRHRQCQKFKRAHEHRSLAVPPSLPGTPQLQQTTSHGFRITSKEVVGSSMELGVADWCGRKSGAKDMHQTSFRN